MLKHSVKKAGKNIEKFRRKLTKRRNFDLETVPVGPKSGPIWAQRQIAQYGTKHLFRALIMLKLSVKKLAKKSEKNIKRISNEYQKRQFWACLDPF